MKNNAPLSNTIKILTFTILLLAGSSIKASKEDSLLVVLKTSKDSNRVNTLNNLAWEYLYNQPDKALSVAKKALELAIQLNYLKGESTAYTRIGIVYDLTAKYDSAIYYYNKSLQIAKKLNNAKGIGGAYSNLGLTYWNIGNYAKALDYFLKAVAELNKINDLNDLGNTYNNIGLIYFDLDDFEKAKKYFFIAKKFNEQSKNDRALAACLTNIGGCFNNNTKKDSALYYYNESLIIKRKLNDYYGIAITLVDMGIVHHSLKNYSKAIEYFEEGIDYKKMVKDKWGEASARITLASSLKENNNIEKALEHCLIAEQISDEINSYKLKAALYLLLSEIHRSKNIKVSLDYLNKYVQAKDSVSSEEKEKTLAELSAKFETEAKENQIKLLNQKSEIAELASQKNKQQRNAIALASLSIISIAFLVYNRKKNQQKIELEQQKLEQEKIKLSSIIEAQEAERKRISEELHDGVGQLLSAAKLTISSLDDPENEKLKNAMDLVDTSCQEIRNISHNLMPAILVKSGLIDAIKQFAININSSGKMEIKVDGAFENKLTNETEIHIYRIIQELLNNIIKYANATKVDIQLFDDEKEIAISIEDNGGYFDVKKITQANGNGWLNIQSRMSILKGTYEIDSKQNKGTAVHIYVPLIKEHAKKNEKQN